MATEAVLDMLEQIELRSQLTELERVPPWVEALAARFAIPQNTVFAIDLCLEEALSNIIRHGYAKRTDGPIVVQFESRPGEWIFVIEDEAPHFRPPATEVPTPQSLENVTPGGLGIPLMRRFAQRFEWEPRPTGNRLTLGFAWQT